MAGQDGLNQTVVKFNDEQWNRLIKILWDINSTLESINKQIATIQKQSR